MRSVGASCRKRSKPKKSSCGQGTPNLPASIIPAKICRLKMSGKSPMDMIIPPLTIDIMFESNPLKSRILVLRLAVASVGIAPERSRGCASVRGSTHVILDVDAHAANQHNAHSCVSVHPNLMAGITTTSPVPPAMNTLTPWP